MYTHINYVQNAFFILEKEKSSTQNFYKLKIEIKTPYANKIVKINNNNNKIKRFSSQHNKIT